MQKLVLDVFGRRMLAERSAGAWHLYLPGTEGKRRPVKDVVVPGDVTTEQQLLRFLDDHFHEHATVEHPAVRIVE